MRAQVGRSVWPAIVAGRRALASSANLVTGHLDSWLSATLTGLCRLRHLVSNAGRHEWRRALRSSWRASSGPRRPCCPRHALPAVSGCAAPVRDRPHPHRARRRGRHRDRDPAAGPLQRLLATQVLLPAELMVRRADSTEVIGNVLVAKSRSAGYGKHRPLRASRVDRPPITAGRARAARAVALPPRRRPCGPGRPGVAGPASGRSPTLFWLQPGQAAGCWLVATV